MATVAAVESDFSFRKLKIAGVCLFGQLFGTSMLLVGPLSMLMIPMTQQFGWSRYPFLYAKPRNHCHHVGRSAGFSFGRAAYG